MPRKIILSLAMSLDGYILDKNGKFDWVVGDGYKNNDTKKQFVFSEFLKSTDTMVMGKKSYTDSSDEAMKMFKSQKIYVASYDNVDTKYNNVKFIKGDIVSQITKLKKEEGKDIWIFGGAVIADLFIKADVIDEYIMAIIPVILGDGKTLFLENNPKLKLHMKECTVTEGIAMLKYTRRK